MKRLLVVLLAIYSLSLALPTLAVDTFRVDDIKVTGLQRIADGTVFNYLPIRVGEEIDAGRVSEAIDALYRTGFFDHIEMLQDGNVLWLKLIERPSIAKITFSGNKDIPTDQLTMSLKDVGLAEGRIFNRSLLDKIEQELRRQYFSQGKYAVNVKTEFDELEFNRVAISITIDEGEVATIQQINLVGNLTFDNETLLDELQLQSSEDEGWMGSDDQYSKNKLSADLETLRSYYMDRGYANFSIDSTQVSISPGREHVYITINMTEGAQYHVADPRLSGDMVLPEKELHQLLVIKAGDVFSRKKISRSTSAISDRLGELGFAFANINAIPEFDEEKRIVTLTFFVDPGRRVYIRRILMEGNSNTRDEVLRREVRVMEGGWIDTSKVKRSRSRLERLGFFETVSVETPSVPGTTDQVDLKYRVVEQPSGTLMASIGYSEIDGMVFSLSVSQNNFLGSGNKLDLTLNNSDVTKIYKISYTDPYYTLDGVSRGFSVYKRETDASEADILNYETNTIGGNVRYGIPLTEFTRMSLSLGGENTELVAGISPSTQVQEFLNENGDEFDTITWGLGWSYDSRNRAFFATKGTKVSWSLDAALPGGDLEYYKINYRHNWFTPLGDSYALGLKFDLGYGDGYGDSKSLPFFKNFYAGGVRTVRGYDGNSLGPRELIDTGTEIIEGDPLGGNLRVIGKIELVLPILRDVNTAQVVTFIDGGNVFDVERGHYDSSEVRYSYGISSSWMSPVGPMTFSLAKPYNDKVNDRTERFQFSLGIPL